MPLLVRTSFLLCTLFLFCSIANAQQIRRCGTWEYFQLQQQKDPYTLQRWKNAQVEARQWLEKNPASTRTTIIIPVVVHVVYNTSAQNISDAQIRSQIDVLNEDFNRSNADSSRVPAVWKSIASSLPIQFCLAAYDPEGNPTSGIERIKTTKTSFDAGDDALKHTNQGGANGWTSEDYLNIWVCNLVGGALGYATMPGSGSSKEDGIVIRYNAFGRRCGMNPPYNLGRTATHEIGHWLGLSHVWGDDGGSCAGSDYINDTPNQADSTMGCPAFPRLDQCTPDVPGVMFMNYMDYTDDDCMYMFTADQTAEMLSILNTERVSLQNSPGGCQPLYHLDAALSRVVIPKETLNLQSFQPEVQLFNRGSDVLEYIKISCRVDGQPVQSTPYAGSLPPGGSAIVPLLTYFTGEGGHVFNAWTSDPNHGMDEYPSNDTVCNEFLVASTIPKNTMTVSPNPVSDLLFINLENPSDHNVHLQIVNSLGQIVGENDLSLLESLVIQFDVSDLSNDIYFVYAHIGYDYVEKKVMVQK
jgi:hypothetical protein